MVRLYAHRGAAAELPENTIPSFERALEVGADALEMDVHLSRDGHVVVSHDPDGTRTAGAPASIQSCDLDELKTWDVGLAFEAPDGAHPFAGKSFEIPTLAEVLEHFPDTIINIDLKQHHPSMVAETLALIRKYDAEERVQIASFHLPTLLSVRSHGYGGITSMAPAEIALALFAPSVLVRRIPLLGCAAQPPTRAEFLRQSVDEVGLTLGGESPLHLLPGSDRLAELPRRLFPSNEWMVKRFHQAGLRVEFWTVNDPREAIHLAEIGADGIMTDDPRRIAEALKNA